MYPTKAPNGSTIIIYGHESGIRVIWHGGHPLEDTSSSSPFPSTSSDEPEFDPFEPYPHITHTVDVDLASEALHLAVPPLTSTGFEKSHTPPLMETNLVVAVACSDCEIRVVSLPLQPPPKNPQNDNSGAAVVRLGGPRGHQDLISDLSLTWTAPKPLEIDSKDTQWNIVVASGSSDGGGLLLLFRIDVHHLHKPSEDAILLPPFQRVRLASTPQNVAFNCSVYPSRRHSTLLITESAGAARIYDFAAHKRPASRGGPSGDEQWQRHGSWLVSYITPYTAYKNASSSSPCLAAPKQILGAEWVLHGTGIFVLLANGEWGVWRQDFAKNDDQKLVSQSCRFVIAGRVDPTSRPTAAQADNSFSNPSFPSLTPNTKMARQMKLFGNSDAADATHSPGGVSVTRTISPSGNTLEESLVMWYDSHVFGIPNFDTYWDKCTFGHSHAAGSLPALKLNRLDNVSLRGDIITNICQIPNSRGDKPSVWQHDLLLTGGRRFGIWAIGGFPRPTSDQTFFPAEQFDEEALERDDQALLHASELGIDGINRRIDQMMNNLHASNKRVGFSEPIF